MSHSLLVISGWKCTYLTECSSKTFYTYRIIGHMRYNGSIWTQE